MAGGDTDTAAAQAASSAVPWLVLGAVLGIALLALVTSLSVLAARHRSARSSPEPERDDLATFLEHPPGSPGALPAAGSGWPGLATGPEPEPPAPPRFGDRRLGIAAGAAAVALVIGGLLAALAATDRPASVAPVPSPELEAVEARLTFGGVVLERRAVGVTATYPYVEVRTDGDAPVATVELPTWNCLTDRAPADPEEAGCTRSVTEIAELPTPELEVTSEGGALRLSGGFATSLRRNGSAPEPTGRSYRITVTATAGPGAGWVPADGVLELGDDEARTEDGSELRLGDQ